MSVSLSLSSFSLTLEHSAESLAFELATFELDSLSSSDSALKSYRRSSSFGTDFSRFLNKSVRFVETDGFGTVGLLAR